MQQSLFNFNIVRVYTLSINTPQSYVLACIRTFCGLDKTKRLHSSKYMKTSTIPLDHSVHSIGSPHVVESV